MLGTITSITTLRHVIFLDWFISWHGTALSIPERPIVPSCSGSFGSGVGRLAWASSRRHEFHRRSHGIASDVAMAAGSADACITILRRILMGRVHCMDIYCIFTFFVFLPLRCFVCYLPVHHRTCSLYYQRDQLLLTSHHVYYPPPHTPHKHNQHNAASSARHNPHHKAVHADSPRRQGPCHTPDTAPWTL